MTAALRCRHLVSSLLEFEALVVYVESYTWLYATMGRSERYGWIKYGRRVRRIVLVEVCRVRIEIQRVLIVFYSRHLRFMAKSAGGWRLKSEQCIDSGLAASMQRLDALSLDTSALEYHIVLRQEWIQPGV